MKEALVILCVCLFFTGFSQRSERVECNEHLDEKLLAKVSIVDSTFILLLDSLMNEHIECESFDEKRVWYIEVEQVEGIINSGKLRISYSGKLPNDYLAGETEPKTCTSLYISRAFYSEVPYEAWGYLYYGNILFVMIGYNNTNIFTKSNDYRKFKVSKREIDPFIYDPPRVACYYLEGKFYMLSLVPCGG